MTKLTGTIKKIASTQVISDKFQKREFVLTTDEDTQWPQSVLLEFTKDNCDRLDQFKEGDKVEVDINIRGREWANPQGEIKYFNTLQAWKIAKVECQGLPASNAQSQDDDFEDVPF